MKDNLKLAFNKNKSWGVTTSLDLRSCNPQFIRDGDKIKEFVSKLCILIGVKRAGDCIVVNFGENKKVEGFSMVQLIDTSLVSSHFANKTNSAYLDIFSCKYYNPEEVANFCKEFFQAKDCQAHYFFRKYCYLLKPISVTAQFMISVFLPTNLLKGGQLSGNLLLNSIPSSPKMCSDSG